MPKVFKNAEFGRVTYSVLVLAAICFVAYSFVLPTDKVSAQKFDKNSESKSTGSEQLATSTFPTSTVLPLAITDNFPAGVNASIPVAGLTDQVRGVALNISFDNPGAGPAGHTWIGDLVVTLGAPPAGTPSHLIMQRVGSTTGTGAGDSSNVVGPYTFTDGSTGDIWVAAAGGPTDFSIPAGSYRTTACCANSSAGPAIFTQMNPVFQGPALTGFDANKGTQGKSGMPRVEDVGNGTWNLNISDNAGGDTGRVSALSLTVTFFAPTSALANVSGAVVTQSGQPISYARISILDTETLQTQTVMTNQFGIFRFEGLTVEHFYSMWVEHGRYQFDQPVQTFVLSESLDGVRFISNR